MFYLSEIQEKLSLIAYPFITSTAMSEMTRGNLEQTDNSNKPAAKDLDQAGGAGKSRGIFGSMRKENKSSRESDENENNLTELHRQKKQQNEKKLKLCIGWILKIELQQSISNTDNDVFQETDSSSSSSSTYGQKSNKAIVVSLLTRPLETRFRFHFFGNRKTNSLDKVNAIRSLI